MANREGEFDLVFEPEDVDANIVEIGVLSDVSAALNQLFQVAFDALPGAIESPGQVRLFHAAPPERGSIHFPMWVAFVAGLGVAANLSQVTGVNLSNIFKALAHLVHRTTPPPSYDSEAARLIRHAHFVQFAERVVDVASERGFRSIRLEDATLGVSIELTRENASDADVARYTEELADMDNRIAEYDRMIQSGRQNFRANAAHLRGERDDLQAKLDRIIAARLQRGR